MSRQRHRGSLLQALAASALVLSAAHPVTVSAQSPSHYGSGTAPPTGTTNAQRGIAVALGGGASEAVLHHPDAIPSDDPLPDSDLRDHGHEPQPRAGQRTVRRDGDLGADEEPPLLRDGIADLGEPEAPLDGVDPTSIDARDPEDHAAFENPPSPFDPLLFQIEETEPILDRRPRRLFAFEPYDPVGMRTGSFVLFPEVELAFDAYSNVFRSPAARSDSSFAIRPAARLVSNWRTHALEFRTSGTLSAFNEFDSENEGGYLIEARGRLDITRRTNVQAVASRELTQESRSAIDASSVGERADINTDRAALTLQHRFNRLTLQLRGSVTDQSYGDVTAGGVVTSNDDRDVTTTEEALRASWELKPTLFLFSEVAVNQRAFQRAARSDNMRRDSNGERYRVGLSFGNTGQILRGEVSVGYGIQRPDDPRLDDIGGVLFDSNLAWRLSELTSLLFSARSDVSETTTAGSGGVFTHQVGVDARHAFRRHLIGTAGLAYSIQDYSGVSIDEREWRATLGVEYFLDREAVLFSRYAHTAFNSSQPNSDYGSDEIRLGLRLRR